MIPADDEPRSPQVPRPASDERQSTSSLYNQNERLAIGEKFLLQSAITH